MPRKKCYQKIIREQEEAKEGLKWWEDLDLSPQNAEVRIIDKDTAKDLILTHEWLGTCPPGAFFYVGLYICGKLAGAEVFTETKAGSHYSLWNEKATCLARGCCVFWAPKWASSFLISRALKLLAEHYGNEPRYVLAYSDHEAGEIGTVYQATNWIYIREKLKREWRNPEGKRHDHNRHRDVAKQRDPEYKIKKRCNPEIVEQVKQEMLAEGWKQSKTWRGTYVTVIGKNGKEKKRLLKKLQEAALPYPKEHKYE